MERRSSSASSLSMRTKNNKCCPWMLICCDYFYDTLSGLISLLDVITDVMILVYYYQTKKPLFFYLSLSILSIAQLSYATLFMIRFASHLKIRYKILTFCVVLPLCPFMSYIFYWASLRNNKLSQFLKYIGLHCSEYEPPSEKQAEKLGITKLQEYFAEKLVNHTGFVLEAICESFPQSILQCIAMILYYNTSSYYYNVLTFISILISLISISTKSLMFSASLNISTFFFNWLCAISDFFGLYLIFVWVFFVPDIVDPNVNGRGDYSLSLFASIWLWKFIICTVAPITIGTFILSIFIAVDLYDDITLDMYKESLCEYIYKFWIIVGIIISFAVVWSFAVALLIIFGEVLCCTWIAIGFYYYNESRFSHSRTFMKIFYWLYLSASSDDLLIRLIAVNYRLSHTKMMNDTTLHTFLTHVIENDLRFNTEKHDDDAHTPMHAVDTDINITSDKDPELFDHLPIDINVTTNMLFESADGKQQKQLRDYYEEYEGCEKLHDFGTSLLTNEGYIHCGIKSLKDITYKDFRTRCKNRHKTHLVTIMLKQMWKAMEEDKQKISELQLQQTYVYGINILEIRIAKLCVYIQLIADYILWFLFVPLYAISRIFNLFIPIIGMILVPHIHYIQFFQWILTVLFFILIIGLIVLFPSVWKFQFLAWHVAPGYSIISPKIHNDNMNSEDRTKNNKLSVYTVEDEYTTTLEEILSDRSCAQNSESNQSMADDSTYDMDDHKERVHITNKRVVRSPSSNTNNNNIGNGTRRARRIRRKHQRQQRKQKKKKLKRIREKIRKYEKLEFYEWVKEFYYKCISIPMIRKQIIDRFGTDIGSIILAYLPSIVDEDDNVVMKEVIDDNEISKTLSDSYTFRDYYDNIDEDIMDNNNSSAATLHVTDGYSEYGNASNHTNSNSFIDEVDNPLLCNTDDNNNRNRNQSSLLYYEDLSNQSVFASNDDRNCNTVDLSQLYNDVDYI